MRNLLFGFLIFLTACSSDSNSKNTSDLSLKDELITAIETGKVSDWLENEVEQFLLTDSEVVLTTKKSSRIHIPKNAFVRNDGSAPKGKVTLVFKEYQTAGEILASGLPMKYTDPSGKTIDFESAGMFEIRALDGKDTLELRKGKEIKVELATPDAGKYNFYGLSDNTRGWTEIAKNQSPVPNPYIQDAKDSLSRLEQVMAENQPKKPVPYSPTDKLFDIKVNPAKYPEFKEIGGVMWKYTGSKKSEDPAYNTAYFNKKYSFTKLAPKKGEYLEYDVSFASTKDTIVLTMAPVFPGKLKEKGEKKLLEKIKKFNEALNRSEKIRSQQRNEAKLLRMFNVDKLGIYNYDRQYKTENIPILAAFYLDGKPMDAYPGASVFLIPEGKLCVVQYGAETQDKFAINPYERNQLIAVIGENEVYALDDKAIRNLNLPQFKNKTLKIELKPIKQKVKTGADIDAVLASL